MEKNDKPVETLSTTEFFDYLEKISETIWHSNLRLLDEKTLEDRKDLGPIKEISINEEGFTIVSTTKEITVNHVNKTITKEIIKD